jgi:hypothetical protein
VSKSTFPQECTPKISDVTIAFQAPRAVYEPPRIGLRKRAHRVLHRPR